MDHVYTLLLLTVPCSVLCGHVPAPVNVQMDSHHFIHMLRWQAGPGSPPGLHYRVTFCSTKEDWKTVDSCVAVQSPLSCNLTDVFSDLEAIYYFSVTAVLGNESSVPGSCPPFIPIKDTIPEPPSVRLSTYNDSLLVYLHPPSASLHSVYEKFKYALNVTNGKGVQFSRTTNGLDTIALKVVPGLQYCVSVNITHPASPAIKPPVCASKPVPVDNTDLLISVTLCLLVPVFVVVAGLLVLKRFIHSKSPQPLVLSSFNPPYKVRLMPWPTDESVNRVLLEPRTYEDVQVIEEVDPEKEDEEVAYEGRRGDEEDVCCEEISEVTGSSLPSVIQCEPTHSPVTKRYSNVPQTFLEDHTLAPDVITPHWEATAPQTTSQILTEHLKRPIQELKNNDLAFLLRGDELGQEEEEDSDNVNFFSLTLRHQNSEQEQTEKEEKMENVKEAIPEVPLFVLQLLNPAMDIQPEYSESTTKCIACSEEEEEEDTEDEEAFSGYMMRN